MKILAFSDLHLSRAKAEVLVAESEKADLVIGAGDFCNRREGLSEAMLLLADIKRPFVMVPGNAESADELRNAAHAGMHVLHGEGIEIDHIALFGIGYAIPVTPFGSWSCDLTEEIAAGLLDRCDHADILISHSPPNGVADQTSQGESWGSTALHDAIKRAQPELVLCGHIHDSWGQSGKIGRSSIHNLGPTPNWFEL